MQSTRMNLLLLFSRIALAPDEQALTVSQWWKLPLLREEISRVHLYSPAQLCERFGFSLGLKMVRLLNRAETVLTELTRYAADGIYSLVRGDKSYPAAMAQALGEGSQGAPLVFLACGESAILRQAALGVTGSREPDADMRRFAAEAGRACAEKGLALCEGGARGVDTLCEYAALGAGGKCVCFPAVGLLARLAHPSVERAVGEGRLLLLSNALPEEGFATYRALARNHYIAAHAGRLLAIGARDGIGGTWRCASDALEHGWAQVFPHGGAGEAALFARGGQAGDVFTAPNPPAGQAEPALGCCRRFWQRIREP